MLVRRFRERKRIEDLAFVVSGPVLKRPACSEGPFGMNPGRQHCQNESVGAGNRDQSIIREDFTFHEHENAMFRGDRSHDVTIEAYQRRSKLTTWLAEHPPVITIARAAVDVALRFYGPQEMLVDLREASPDVGL